VPRSSSGYRLFSEAHLDQMRLARRALHGGWPGKRIRESALALVRQAAAGDLGGALEQAHHHLSLVQAEHAQAEAAAELLEQWARGPAVDAAGGPLQQAQAGPLRRTQGKGLWIGEAARLLDVTPDMLRNWERNGLLRVPRDPDNGYRLYGEDEIARLRVIRMLNRAGYSQMAILRMMLHLDASGAGDLRNILDTPRPDEDVYTAADRWLSTLAEQEERAQDLIAQVEAMIDKHR
jgi:DNA-binding transcriptional MerR regulator